MSPALASFESTRLEPAAPPPETPASGAQWSEITVTSGGDWISIVVSQLRRLSRLEEDWDSYGSPPPQGKATQRALLIAATIDLSGITAPAPTVAPTAGGGLQLELEGDRRGLEIEILADGSMEYLRLEDGEPIEEGTLEFDASTIVALVAWVQRQPGR